MSVSVSMPQLGESVTEGTVTRWLKREGEHVEADEPLLEVSTDKVDTEIPSPVSGVLRGITVAEDETVAVGAELAVIDEDGSGGGAAAGGAAAGGAAGGGDGAGAAADGAGAAYREPADQEPAHQEPAHQEPAYQEAASQEPAQQPQAAQRPVQQQAPPAPSAPPQAPPPSRAPDYRQAPPSYQEPYRSPGYEQPPPPQPAPQAPGYQGTVPAQPPAAPQPQAYQGRERADAPAETAGAPAAPGAQADGAESPYVTPLVRKLAAEHGVDLASVAGTGVGGRIRKQDVLDAARLAAPASPPPPAAPAPPPAAPPPAAPAPAPAAGVQAGAPPASRPAIVPSSLRGRTERLSRARQVIAQRMVESLQTSAQLTTVVEADVTAIARLRARAKTVFEAREGVKLSFLPFFALAVVEALKVHPKLNAVIDTEAGVVTYHDDEHLGIAVDTERGLMVPVIRNAGDLNIAGLARKIADLAARTRAGQVSPDDLSGGTFTLTNTGSRGALFDTPIINQPQVGILGTGTVVKRAVVVEDPTLGEVITVRSMVYLALTYDHRLVDGADAARFLITLKNRLEEGAFETELGL
jgi:2-oxoglutarate dehydrogenase E2 component (dihydrolipoamide succinyltransferase)